VDERSDTELLLASRADPATFVELYRRHAEDLLRYFARRTLDPEAAAELTAETFAEAFVKSQLAAGVKLPSTGKVFVSVRAVDKPKVVEIAGALSALGFSLIATRGTAAYLADHGLTVQPVNKVAEGRPHIVDMIKNGEIAMIINTTDERRSSIQDSYSLRRSALQARVTYYTTVAGARAACAGMQQMRELRAYSVQQLHASLGRPHGGGAQRA
jgi:carbamoyl-phosphate synthase large subunit